MKFHELAIGQKFEFQGVAYIKTTPMIASEIENSNQKFMARSAAVKPLDVSIPPPKPGKRMLEAELVHTSFEAFYARCQTALKEIQDEIKPESWSEIQEQITKERQIFLSSL